MSAALQVDTEDLLTAALLFRRTADDLRDTATALNATLLELITSTRAHDIAVDLGEAVNGPNGIAAVGAQCAEYDVKLRLAAGNYDASDFLVERGITRLVHDLAGDFVHKQLAVVTSLRHPNEDEALALIRLHPLSQAFELVMVGTRGVARVRDEGVDPAPLANTPPRSLRDVIAGLVLRDRAKHGAIDVRFVQRPDGTRTVIVDVPGLEEAVALAASHDVASLATCARAVDGSPTAYEDGIIKAMKLAGVTRSDHVMLVGHSLGGMIAVNASKTLTGKGYQVTHVMTIGSPIGRTVGSLPSSVRVLAVENTSDRVPDLDLRSNPRKRNIATVTFDRSTDGTHDSRRVYLPGVAALEADGDPAVRDFAVSARDFLDGTSVQTHRYTVTKGLY